MIIVVFLFETNLTVNATPLGKTSGIICGRRVSSLLRSDYASCSPPDDRRDNCWVSGVGDLSPAGLLSASLGFCRMRINAGFGRKLLRTERLCAILEH
jgi:hypothetical protein